MTPFCVNCESDEVDAGADSYDKVIEGNKVILLIHLISKQMLH